VQSIPPEFTAFAQMDIPVITSLGFIISFMLVSVSVFTKMWVMRLDTEVPEKSLNNQTLRHTNLETTELDPSQASIQSQDFTVVIPTLNEAGAIGKVIDELRSYGYNNILIVDSPSTDNTVEIAKNRGVKVVFQEGKGKSNAIRTALKHVKTAYMLVMDGDYTYDPKYVNELLRYAGSSDEVIGARIYGRSNIPLLHRFGNYIITTVFNLLFSTSMSDVCSGMYLIKTDIANELSFESADFSIEVELATHVASTTRRLTDIPIAYRARIGEAKLKSIHGILILWTAVRLAWLYNPAFFIFSVASLALIPSLAVLGWAAYELLFLGVKHYVWALIGIVGAGIGVISFMLTIMSLYLKRMEYRLLERIRKLG